MQSLSKVLQHYVPYLRKTEIILLYFKDFHWSNITVLEAPVPCVFIQGYPGGGFSHLPSSFNICDLSEAKVARNCSAGTTRKNLRDRSPQKLVLKKHIFPYTFCLEIRLLHIHSIYILQNVTNIERN